MLDQAVEGVIAVYSERKYHYTEHEQERLKGLTSAISIVLNHAKLLTAFKERLRLIYGVSTQLSTPHSLEELFPQVVDAVLATADPKKQLFLFPNPRPTSNHRRFCERLLT